MLVILMIIGSILLRLVPHIPNFAPITATALFGGAYLNKRVAIFVPLLAMIVSDYLLLYVNPYRYLFFDFSKVYLIEAMFHSTTLYVWGSFIISGLIGVWLKTRKKPKYIIGATFVASLQFFLITNFGVWTGGMYSRGLDGLIQSYIMGLPFFKWTILGDFFYTGTFFITYELAIKLTNKSLAFVGVSSKIKIH